MKPKRLRLDGSYSSDHGMICAYSAPGHERKERFLRDAAALLRETGRHLARRGLTQSDVRINRAGMAVSGEASADLPLLSLWPKGRRIDPRTVADVQVRTCRVRQASKMADASGRRPQSMAVAAVR